MLNKNSDKTNVKIKQNYKEAPLSKIHLRVMVAVILGQFTCGFSLGITGTALTNAAKYMPISDLWTGLIGAGGLIGLASSVLVGRLSDRIGRRALLTANMFILAFFSLLHLVTNSLPLTFLIRIGIGLMMAIDYTVGNALLTEWLPQGEDSKRQSHLLIYWVLGFITAYVTGTYLDGLGTNTWQVILATSAVPALVTAGFRALFPLPASPGWLASKGQVKTANQVIGKKLGHKWGISRHFKQPKKSNQPSWTILFSKKYLRQTLVGGMFYACQTFAFFGISIFLPILLNGMGISNPQVSGNLYNTSMLLGIFLGIFIFKRLSRRLFLTSNFLISTILMLILALTPHSSPTFKLVLFAIFAIILSSGLVLDYPYPTELFDGKVQASGVDVCITISRFGAAAGTFLLPVLTRVGGTSLAILVCAAVLFSGYLLCLFWAPETSPKYLKRTHQKAAK